MEAKEAITQIDSCDGCGLCLDVCQTCEVTQSEAFSHRECSSGYFEIDIVCYTSVFGTEIE